jgi:glycosyltransferase involved in cell wall biosynthesis
LIIVDAGSTDNTIDIIRKYEQYVTYWVSEPDRGQSHAIQKGLDKVTGDIVNWLNSDDLLAPGALSAIATEFDLAKFDVFCGYCDYFVNTLANLDKRNERMKLFDTVGHTLTMGHMNQPSTFFKASVMKRLGIDEQFRYTMDVDLWYRYLLEAGHQRVQFSDTLLTYFRLHESSKSVAENSHFTGDIFRVFYNIAVSLNQPPAVLSFIRTKIPIDANFIAKTYPIGVPIDEVKEFVRYLAWQALIYYNEQGDTQAARECLRIAYHHGQPLTGTLVRQLAKHYLVPEFMR